MGKLQKLLLVLPLTLALASCGQRNEPDPGYAVPDTFQALCTHLNTPDSKILFVEDKNTHLIYFKDIGFYAGGYTPYYKNTTEIMTSTEFKLLHWDIYHSSSPYPGTVNLYIEER